MKSPSLFVLFCCLFLSVKSLIGQQDSSLINVQEETQILLFDDTLSHDSDMAVPYTIMEQEGYFIIYIYKKGNDYYNYNLIFVPASDLANPLIQNIVKKSIVVNKREPLLENYFISEENIKEFEKIFKFSWVVRHDFVEESDSLINIKGYNIKNGNMLASEYLQFHLSRKQRKIQDSIGIIFKLLKIEGVFKLESYNISSQMNHYNRRYKDSNYFKKRKAIYMHIYKEMRMCKLDYRFISPILSHVLAIEFKDRKWRRFASNL